MGATKTKPRSPTQASAAPVRHAKAVANPVAKPVARPVARGGRAAVPQSTGTMSKEAARPRTGDGKTAARPAKPTKPAANEVVRSKNRLHEERPDRRLGSTNRTGAQKPKTAKASGEHPPTAATSSPKAKEQKILRFPAPVKPFVRPQALPVEAPRPLHAHPETARARLSKSELGDLRHALVAERSRLTGVVEGLREQSLLRHDEVNHEEDGTDAFIRLFDLDRASNEQSQIVKIDAAIRAIDEGAYGLCDRCGCRIEKPRLQALPFVKTCIKCQSEAEGGHRGRVSARHRLWE